MVGRDDEGELLIPDHVGGQPADPVQSEKQPDVGAVLGDERNQVLLDLAVHRDFDLGIVVHEVRQQRRQQVVGDDALRRDGKFLADGRAHGLQRVRRLARLAQHVGGIAQEGLAGSAERWRPARAADEQRLADLAFEPGDMGADGWLSDPQPVGGLAEAPGFDHREKNLEAAHGGGNQLLLPRVIAASL